MARTPTDIKSLARIHTKSALATLAHIMRQKKAPAAARVAAAQALLDRGWGKPAQVVTGDDSGLPISVIHRVIVQLPVVDQLPLVDHDGNVSTAKLIEIENGKGTGGTQGEP